MAVALSFAFPALCLLVSAVNANSKQRLNRSPIQPARLQTPRSFVLCNTVFQETKQMFYVKEKGELIDPSQQKFPKRWPDNRAPVIIRIDGTNLLLMIRKMRSSRPHFKYIFHYGGADKQHCWFHHQSLSRSLFLPLKYSIPTSPGPMSHFGNAWIVPNWKHLF